MENVTWSRREKTADGVQSTLMRNGHDIARDATVGDATTIEVGGEDYALTADPNKQVEMVSTSGTRFVAQASEEGKKLRRAERITITAPQRTLMLVNENATNWVIEDADEEKLGQFTGFHSGVRDVELDFSDCPADRAMTDAEIAFTAWMARFLLEKKLEVRSTIFIATLALLSIIALAVFVS